MTYHCTLCLFSLSPDILLISFLICLADFSSFDNCYCASHTMVMVMLQSHLLFEIPLYLAQKENISLLTNGFLTWSGPFDSWALDDSLKVSGRRDNHSEKRSRSTPHQKQGLPTKQDKIYCRKPSSSLYPATIWQFKSVFKN